MEYGDDLYEEFGNMWFSYTGSSRKDLKPWHWKNCKISFEKNSDDTIRFMVKRIKNIFLDNNTKLRWDKKNRNADSKLNKLRATQMQFVNMTHCCKSRPSEFDNKFWQRLRVWLFVS